MPTEVRMQDSTTRSPATPQTHAHTTEHDHNRNENADPQNDDDDDDDEWLFSCRCESAKSVSSLLSCLRHVSSSADDDHYYKNSKRSRSIQPVTVFCSPSSITFHVYGTARQSQASVDLQAGLFSDYKVATNPNPNITDDNGNPTTAATAGRWQAGGEFCVNLSTVLECMNILGTQTLDKTKLSLSYNTTNEVFKLELLEDSGVLSTAAIPGMLPPDTGGSSLALAFRSTPIVARMILKSEWLREALSELDVVSGATCCVVVLSPHGLELAAAGHAGECLILLPPGAAIVSLDCGNTPQARSYPLTSFLGGMRGLEYAAETCISINEAGMIAIQHQILDHVGQGAPNFVDFIMSCLLDEEDESTGGTQERPRSRGTVSQESADPPYSLGWDDTSKRPLSIRASASAASTRGSRMATSAHDDDHDDDDSDDEEEDDNLPAISKAPLFGALTMAHQPTQSARRRRRQTMEHHGDESDGSKALLGDESVDGVPALDVTARATPPRRRRIQEDEDGSSSPELVYK